MTDEGLDVRWRSGVCVGAGGACLTVRREPTHFLASLRAMSAGILRGMTRDVALGGAARKRDTNSHTRDGVARGAHAPLVGAG